MVKRFNQPKVRQHNTNITVSGYCSIGGHKPRYKAFYHFFRPPKGRRIHFFPATAPTKKMIENVSHWCRMENNLNTPILIDIMIVHVGVQTKKFFSKCSGKINQPFLVSAISKRYSAQPACVLTLSKNTPVTIPKS